ncbi:MAG: cupin domain-containing protein [Candidatus Sumerlaeota bacterium]
MPNPAYWIEKLNLQPHPEGGHFAEAYRSAEMLEAEALPERFSGPRNIATSIYFLLRGNDFSAFHRIHSDETWHYYDGNTSIDIHQLHPDGRHETAHLGIGGQDALYPQATIPAGVWFGAELSRENAPDTEEPWTLVGCTVAPGFDFADFEIAEKPTLNHDYPQHRRIIERLTRHIRESRVE